jgi:alkylation response protein AidB-like acyl-CoA dehydrogenase
MTAVSQDHEPEVTAAALVGRARALRPELGQAMVPDAGEHGMPRICLFVAPRSAFTVLDDWGDSLGLKGTGSDTIRFGGAHVPAHAVLEDVNMLDVAVEHGTPGVALHGNPMYGGRALVIFTLSLARTVIGGAYNALDEYADWCRDKPTPLLLRTIGSSAVKNGQRFERLFRDLATMAAHRNSMLREEFFRQLGAIELGVSYPSPGATWPPAGSSG